MSYIDSYDHEWIGELGYLPIYHPLQNIEGEGRGAYDFSATPENLVLGGGSGEHPALVVHQLPSLAAIFLYDQLSEEEEAALGAEEKAFVEDLCFAAEPLEFCGWRVGDFARLQAMAESPAFMHPVTAEEEVENWIEKSLGELIWYALPDLNPHHQALQTIFQHVQIYPSMRNVSTAPPGYPPCGGRLIVEGKVRWGLGRWGNV
ncbi:hypothetical protein ACUY4R_000817 [Kosakonia sp. BK9b]|uniref:hypothetical protein n=1 Tax=Kosakonia sp. TaxID=1916651 RepID=UPI0028A22841|nr:hypothetical protein [Kosakonia sp.]